MATDDDDTITEPDILVEKEDLLTYLKENVAKKDKFVSSYNITGWTMVPLIIVFLLITAIVVLGGVFTLSIVFLFLAMIWAVAYIPVFMVSYVLAKMFMKREKPIK